MDLVTAAASAAVDAGWLAGAAYIAGSLSALVGACVLGFRVAAKIAAPHFASAVTVAMAAELQVDETTSVKDLVLRTADAVDDLAAEVGAERRLADQRHAALVEHQGAVVGFIRLLHRGDPLAEAAPVAHDVSPA